MATRGKENEEPPTTSPVNFRVGIVPTSTTHSVTTEDTYIIFLLPVFLLTLLLHALLLLLCHQMMQRPRLADKSDETAISLGKSHHHKQLLLLCM